MTSIKGAYFTIQLFLIKPFCNTVIFYFCYLYMGTYFDLGEVLPNENEWELLQNVIKITTVLDLLSNGVDNIGYLAYHNSVLFAGCCSQRRVVLSCKFAPLEGFPVKLTLTYRLVTRMRLSLPGLVGESRLWSQIKVVSWTNK